MLWSRLLYTLTEPTMLPTDSCTEIQLEPSLCLRVAQRVLRSPSMHFSSEYELEKVLLMATDRGDSTMYVGGGELGGGSGGDGSGGNGGGRDGGMPCVGGGGDGGSGEGGGSVGGGNEGGGDEGKGGKGGGGEGGGVVGGGGEGAC